MISFQPFHDSTWQHPGIAFGGGAVVLLWLLLSRPRQLPLLCGLQLVMLLDALCTGSLSPVPTAPWWSRLVPVFFVVQGDARFFFLLARGQFSRCKSLGLALLAGLFAPLASYAIQTVLPTWLPTSRHLFLTDELLFCFVAIALLVRLRDSQRGPMLQWQRRLCQFELLQYGLWVCSDLLILGGLDVGFALRILPNFMYYVVFVPFVAANSKRVAV